ncbi:MAG: hypothetical protein QOE44_906 [Solirubrobacteraceae bacterium]|nr:hypothetical protein [Solirubrobacteraceae bacterium]
MGVGLLLGAWRWIWLGLLLVVAVVAAAVLAGDGLVVVAAVPAVPVGMAGIASGVGLRRVVGRRRAAGPWGMTVLGAALLAVAWLPLPIALVERARTVRVDRTRPIGIDERTGRIGGVGLGDAAASVASRFGAVRPTGDGGPAGPLSDAAYPVGPTSLETGPTGHETFMRYRGVAFGVDGTAVWTVQITDRQARTRRGVGVGDSLALVRRAYPGLHCGEDLVGEDEYTPFPFCSGRTDRGAYIYFSASYTRPGVPVTKITLAPFPMP